MFLHMVDVTLNGSVDAHGTKLLLALVSQLARVHVYITISNPLPSPTLPPPNPEAEKKEAVP